MTDGFMIASIKLETVQKPYDSFLGRSSKA